MAIKLLLAALVGLLLPGVAAAQCNLTTYPNPAGGLLFGNCALATSPVTTDTVVGWQAANSTGSQTRAFQLGQITGGGFAGVFSSLRLPGTSSGGTTFTAPASGSTIAITLPSVAGTNGQVLTHGAGDVVAWATPSAAGIVSGPGSSTVGHFAFWNNTSGTLLSDGGAPAAVATSGSASDLGSGTLAAGRLPALTGDVTSSAGSAATTLAAGSASVLNSGTLASARGGAGAITGALKGNGAGVVSQAACTDLSNGATGCSTATGTSGATIPLLNTANTYSAAQRGTPVTLSLSVATATPSFDAGNNFALLLVNASCPCTLANPSTTPVAGQAGQIVVTQSATGSDTLAFGGQYKFSGGVAPTLSTGANAVDILSYYVVSPTVIAVTSLLNFQ